MRSRTWSESDSPFVVVNCDSDGDDDFPVAELLLLLPLASEYADVDVDRQLCSFNLPCNKKSCRTL